MALTIILNNSGKLQNSGRIWYKGKVRADMGAEHFAEDFTFPLQCIREHHENNIVYPYGLEEIDEVTAPLGMSEKSWENCNSPLILNSSAMPPNHLLIRKIDYISNSNMRSENIIGLQSYPATNVVSQGK